MTAAGVFASAVAGLPQGDMGGPVFSWAVELDEAAADLVRAELGSRDLQVQVGLAARLRDLAPAGADLIALPGIDPVIGSVVRHLCRSERWSVPH
jgi:hypothetical protein